MGESGIKSMQMCYCPLKRVCGGDKAHEGGRSDALCSGGGDRGAAQAPAEATHKSEVADDVDLVRVRGSGLG